MRFLQFYDFIARVLSPRDLKPKQSEECLPGSWSLQGHPEPLASTNNTVSTDADRRPASENNEGERMDSCNSFRLCLVQFITGAALLLVSANQALALRCTALSGDDRYSVLNTVQAMHQARIQRQGPLITVFEIGGGDPAMNGSFLYLRIEHNDQVFVWKTGLNVRSVLQLSTGPGNTLAIRAKEDFFDGNNMVRSRTVAYKISFYFNDDTLEDAISIENSTGSPGTVKQ